MQTTNDERPVFLTDYMRGDESSVASPSSVSETWDEQTKRLTHEVKENIPDSVTEFVANLKNADIRVELCAPGEESSVTTRTVLSADSQDDGQEKLSQLSQIAVEIRNNQLTVEQSEEDDIGDNYEVSVSGGSSAKSLSVSISNVMTNGNLVISGNSSGGYNLQIGGQKINLDQMSSSSTISAVQKREVILRVKPENVGDYQLNTTSGNIEMAQGAGRCAVKTESGKVILGTFNGNANIQSEDGSIEAEMVAENFVARSENGRVEVGTVGGAAEIRTGNGAISILKVAQNLNIVSENGKIFVGEIGGAGTIKSENGAITIVEVRRGLKLTKENGLISLGTVEGDVNITAENASVRITDVAGDLTLESKGGSVEVTTVLGSVNIQKRDGSTAIQKVLRNLTAVTKTCSIIAQEVGGFADITSENGQVTIGSVAEGAKVKTSTGKINIVRMSGNLNILTANGAVAVGRCELSQAGNSIYTTTGKVDIGLANPVVTITAQSQTGTIVCTGLVESSRTGGRGSRTVVQASIGYEKASQVPTLDISSQNGSITVKRV